MKRINRQKLIAELEFIRNVFDSINIQSQVKNDPVLQCVSKASHTSLDKLIGELGGEPIGDKDKAQVMSIGWYVDAIEVMSPLRWHLNELVESMESLNSFNKSLGQQPWAKDKIEAAKKANEEVNKHFTPKSTREHETKT